MRRRPLIVREILQWADAYRETTGRYPTQHSGRIPGTIAETWSGINQALRRGRRGLPAIGSLPILLQKYRGRRSISALPPLSEPQILAWCDEHHGLTGAWPTWKSGPVLGAKHERWSAINTALDKGNRGLPGGSSVAQLLMTHRGVRNRKRPVRLTEEKVLAWADQEHAETAKLPTLYSGPIRSAPGETWHAIDSAFRQGGRGLGPGSSLAILLADHRNVRNFWTRPAFTIPSILGWIDAYRAETGRWPTQTSGRVKQAPGEHWRIIDTVARLGVRSRMLFGGEAAVCEVAPRWPGYWRRRWVKK
jgi:hypothetical protein